MERNHEVKFNASSLGAWNDAFAAANTTAEQVATMLTMHADRPQFLMTLLETVGITSLADRMTVLEMVARDALDDDDERKAGSMESTAPSFSSSTATHAM